MSEKICALVLATVTLFPCLVSAEDCPSVDLEFIVDVTTSMLDNRDQIEQVVDCAVVGSGGSIRLGLLHFTSRTAEDVIVHTWNGQSFTSDVNAFKTELATLLPTLGGDGPEPSDEAIRIMLRGTNPTIPPSNCSAGEFNSPFLSTDRVAVLITDDVPGGCDDFWLAEVDEINAHQLALEAKALVFVSSPFSSAPAAA